MGRTKWTSPLCQSRSLCRGGWLRLNELDGRLQICKGADFPAKPQVGAGEMGALEPVNLFSGAALVEENAPLFANGLVSPRFTIFDFWGLSKSAGFIFLKTEVNAFQIL